MKSPRRQQAQLVQVIVYLTMLRMYAQQQQELQRIARWNRFKAFFREPLPELEMAVAFRAANSANTSSSDTLNVALPTGTTTGDVSLFMVTARDGGSGAHTFSVPNYTTLWNGGGFYLGYRVFVGGDVGPTATRLGGTQPLTMNCVISSYSGVDTAAPIDGWNRWLGNADQFCHGPGVNPAFNSSYQVCFWGDNNGTGVTMPGGVTSRATSTFICYAGVADKGALTDGTPTGYFDATDTSGNFGFGAQVVLKVNGASAATQKDLPPTVIGSLSSSTSTATPWAIDYSALQPIQGDLVLIFLSHGNEASLTLNNSFAFLDQGIADLGNATVYRVLPASPPTSVTLTGASTFTGSHKLFLIRLVGQASVSVEQHGVTIVNPGTSMSSPTFTPTTCNADLLLNNWSQSGVNQNVGSPTGPTINYAPGSVGSQNSQKTAFLQLTDKTATTAYSSTVGSSSRLYAFGVLVAGLSAILTINVAGTVATPSAPTVTGSDTVKVARSASILTTTPPTVSGNPAGVITRSAAIATPSAPHVTGNLLSPVSRAGTINASAGVVSGSRLLRVIRAATIAASAAPIVGSNTGLIKVVRSAVINAVPINPFRGSYLLPSQSDIAISRVTTRNTALITIVGNLQPIIIGGGNLPQGSIFQRLLLYVPDYFDKDPAAAAGITIRFAGISAKVTISNHILTTSVIPALPGQGSNITLDLTQYTSLTALVAAINTHTGYTATVGPGATGSPLNLMEVSNVDAIGANAVPFFVTTSQLWRLLMVWAWELEDMIQNAMEGLSELEVPTNG